MSSTRSAARLLQASSAAEWSAARRLLEQYAASLGVDLSFQGFQHELDHLEEEYSPPRGTFLLAEDRGEKVGCAALRPLSDLIGELKRLYVIPEARRKGLGRLLTQAIVAAARSRGYARLRLDTLPQMQEAQRLYEEIGFKPIAAYCYNPVPGAAFLELTL